MGKAEEFIARQKREQDHTIAQHNNVQLERLTRELERLLPLAVARLEADGYPYAGHRKDVRWHDETRVAWQLRSAFGDGDYRGEVLLLADGEMIVSVQDQRYNVSWLVFRPPYFSDPKDLESVVRALTHLARVDTDRGQSRKRRWWQL